MSDTDKLKLKLKKQKKLLIGLLNSNLNRMLNKDWCDNNGHFYDEWNHTGYSYFGEPSPQYTKECVICGQTKQKVK